MRQNRAAPRLQRGTREKQCLPTAGRRPVNHGDPRTGPPGTSAGRRAISGTETPRTGMQPRTADGKSGLRNDLGDGSPGPIGQKDARLYSHERGLLRPHDPHLRTRWRAANEGVGNDKCRREMRKRTAPRRPGRVRHCVRTNRRRNDEQSGGTKRTVQSIQTGSVLRPQRIL